MAVVIVDRRTIIDNAETTTGWTNAGFGVQSDDRAEGNNAVAEQLNISDGSVYFTRGASVDLSNTLVYVYSFNNALQDLWDSSPPPVGLLIGDGTDRIAFNMAGANKKVFSHSEGPTNWQSLVLDGSKASELNTAGLTFVESGSFANLNLSAITQFGCYFETLSKALGGGYNVSVDIMRFGNDGIYVLGGSSSDPGICRNIASADRSLAANAAYGLFREYTNIAFGCQGPLTFGGDASQSTSYFDDSGVVIAFENRDISNDKYYFDVAALNTTTNYFKLSDSTITTAGPYVNSRCNSTFIDYLEFDAVSFVGLGGSITFPSDTNPGAGRTHIVNGCKFSQCREIFPKTASFTNNSISGYGFTAVGVTTAAVIIDSETTPNNWSDVDFTSSGSGHAIGITEPGTYTFTNFTYNGYASSDGTTGNEVVYNNSGGAVTINISGGNTPTVRNGTSATTSVVAAVTVNVNGLPVVGLNDNATEIRVLGAGTTIELNTDGTDATGATGTASTENHRSSTYSFAMSKDKDLDLRILNVEYVPAFISSVTASNNPTNIPVDLKIDRVYNDDTPPSGE